MILCIRSRLITLLSNIWVGLFGVASVAGLGNVAAGRFMTFRDLSLLFIIGGCYVAAIVRMHELCKRGFVGINDKELLVSTPQKAVN
jgi:hypothetical protein